MTLNKSLEPLPENQRKTAFKRIRLDAETAECRLAPGSGTHKLVRHIALTEIAPSPYSFILVVLLIGRS